MEVAGWKNGPFGSRSLMFGVKVGATNAAQFFDKKWTAVEVEVGTSVVVVGISMTFWDRCPELRNSAFGDWMKANGLVPWEAGHPPRLTLTPLGGIRFRLSL